ncbi:hypothetical protein [Sinosporangium siamense]|uniref:hypothetical protein n=1 Tax=Sinosporangium siamense TaxID=1367973 RepID=UPI0036D2DCFA
MSAVKETARLSWGEVSTAQERIRTGERSDVHSFSLKRTEKEGEEREKIEVLFHEIHSHHRARQAR